MYMDNFLGAQRDNIFDDVGAMIYVFDVQFLTKNDTKDWNYFRNCVESIAAKSPQAKIFCLFHKMDLIHEAKRDAVRFALPHFLMREGWWRVSQDKTP
mmetsp:Transcript_18543/g.38921  ORF Transcript_18543/g.38921 Transcript_18543/m.38921 type:complete len:98 (+) Transcript_18543:796-1089(+)